jgi:hypothetical protein
MAMVSAAAHISETVDNQTTCPLPERYLASPVGCQVKSGMCVVDNQ